jgi:uncharacterized protein YciI
MKNFIFFYFMRDARALVAKLSADHVKYWEKIKIQGGPFADYSGGFMCFRAENLEQAISMISQDPFFANDLLSQYWIKEWLQREVNEYN